MSILKRSSVDTNVGETERWLSLLGGASLLAYGLSQRNVAGFGFAAIGGGLVFRGATGHCPMYEGLGMNTSARGLGKGTGTGASIPYELGIRVDREIRIDKTPAELYAFWRNLENLPRFMDHLESVAVLSDRRSRWVAKGPVGSTVSWEAEIINDIENQLIAWRSLEGSDVDNAGSVRFEPVFHGSGTDVKVSLQYNPPAGAIGAAIARLFGEDPGRQIQEDLQHLKQLLETGQAPTRTSRFRPDLATARKDRVWDRDAVQNSSEESFPASDAPSWTP